MKKKILFIGATHGNEYLGVDMIEQFKKTKYRKKFSGLIANPGALAESKRFVEADLNRVFPGKKNGNYEERRAQEILRVASKYDWVVDLHGSASATGIFIIITKFTLANLLLALRFDIDKIVVWPGVPETSGSLSTYMSAGIEIESGFRDDSKIKKALKKKLEGFFERLDTPLDLEKEMKKKQIFWYAGKLEKKNTKRPRGLKNWQKIKDYYPLFVDGQYSDLWCYKFKKVDLFNFELCSREMSL